MTFFLFYSVIILFFEGASTNTSSSSEKPVSVLRLKSRTSYFAPASSVPEFDYSYEFCQPMPFANRVFDSFKGGIGNSRREECVHTTELMRYLKLQQDPNSNSPNLRVPAKTERCGPLFVGIGAMKAGTTSLWGYLSQHPHFVQKSGKEVHYFDRFLNDSVSPTKHDYFSLFPYISPDSFLASSPGGAVPVSPRKFTGEITPAYLFSPLAPKYMHSFFPNVKILVVIRQPTDRTYSQYNYCSGTFRTKTSAEHFHQIVKEEIELINQFLYPSSGSKTEIDTFETLRTKVIETLGRPFKKRATPPKNQRRPLQQEFNDNDHDDDFDPEPEDYQEDHSSPSSTPLNSEYDVEWFRNIMEKKSETQQRNIIFKLYPVLRSLYYYQLTDWIKYFNPNQIMVILTDELYNQPVTVMKRVENFLGIEPYDKWPQVIHEEGLKNTQSAPTGPMKKETRVLLDEFFAPMIDCLEPFLGKDLSAWRREKKVD